MAKQRRAIPARRPADSFDDSVLIRSAESLGRIIGSLQRQLEVATKRLARKGKGEPPLANVNGQGTRAAKVVARPSRPVRRSGVESDARSRASANKTSKRAAQSAITRAKRTKR